MNVTAIATIERVEEVDGHRADVTLRVPTAAGARLTAHPAGQLVEVAVASRAPAPTVGDHALDLPYADVPGGPVDVALEDLVDDLAGGVTVKAVAVPVDEVGVLPGLIFDFTHPDGTQGPRVLLVVDEDQATKFPLIVERAVASAVRGAAQAGR